MKIACLGWGSLVWNPKNLNIKGQWFVDGPILPIEFLRLSEDGRITLVIDEDVGTNVRVLWTLMNTEDETEARDFLWNRECPSADKGKNFDTYIPIVKKNGDVGENKTKSKIQEWLRTQSGTDAVIWTGLDWESKNEKRKKEFKEKPTKEQVTEYLRKLTGAEQCCAEQYVRNTPKQIDTAYRRAIEIELGWSPLK